MSATPVIKGLAEVRLHGRGGQGTVVASLMLARAAMLEGKGVQAFPEFGVERRGAPVAAFLRIGHEPIHLRCRVDDPDHLLVMDGALLSTLEIPPGRGGALVVNSAEPPEALALPPGWRVATLDATRIARARRLGSGALPVVNSPMAAAFARISGLVGLEAILRAVRESAPVAADANVEAAREAWELAGAVRVREAAA